jgi:hypothetical protein
MTGTMLIATLMTVGFAMIVAAVEYVHREQQRRQQRQHFDNVEGENP